MFKKIFKSILSQANINNFYHLPKAFLANILYGFPTRKMIVIGITGTDGKTTTTNMIYQILNSASKKASMISTINAEIGGKSYDTGFHVTSPDPFMIQNFAKKAVDSGDKYLVLEVTSHGLDQFRFWGIKFDTGVITNITHEHLDYHKTFENYKNTKLKLIKNTKFAIVNQSIEGARSLGKVITFGLKIGDFTQRQIKLKLKIPGDYNIENGLAAMAAVTSLGIDLNIARKSLENFKGLKGRMEEIKNKKGIKIYIDFAHTPNGLENALTTLRSRTLGRKLIAVFGAASQRDILKRPIMGEISGRLADITILTAEDPRFEDSNKIIEEIAAGVYSKDKSLGKNLYKEPDRQKAINLSISLARKGDIIGIFGKGHELSMNLDGKKEIPWSDFEAVKEALDGQKGR